MKCPRDNNELEISLQNDEEALYCSKCNGLFLSREIYKKERRFIYALETNNLFNPCVGEKQYKCPRENAIMAKILINNVILDKCSVCDGIWFDKEEINKVIAASKIIRNYNLKPYFRKLDILLRIVSAIIP